jgi:hypothetical protein
MHLKMEKESTYNQKLDYYWSELYLACYRRDLNRVRECFFALKALKSKSILPDLEDLPIIN